MIIRPVAPTILKRSTKQSSQLPANQKKTVLPGTYFEVKELIEGKYNHWQIELEGVTWYAYIPHWEIKKDVDITLDYLYKVYPYTPIGTLEKFQPIIEQTMDYYLIHTTLRATFFLAQIGHESGGLRYLEELASGQAYEGRKDLGNTEKGDGPRYKGRGLIQLTGRANYERAGRALGADFINSPELVATPFWATKVSGWYWKSRNLNYWSDRNDFRAVTRLINGGYNGWNDRIAYLNRAVNALGDVA